MKKYIDKLLGAIIVVIVLGSSIGYAALNKELNISGEVAYRVKADIRITNLLLSGVSDSTELFSSQFAKKQNIIGVNLEKNNSSITYLVEVTNFSDIKMGIFQITGLPDNLTYELSDYQLKDGLCNNGNCLKGAVKTFKITIKYKDASKYDASNTKYNFRLTYDFRPIHKVTYDGLKVYDDYKKEIIDGDTFKMTLYKPFPIGAKPFYGVVATDYRFDGDVLVVENVAGDLTIKTNYIQSIEDLVILSNNVNSGTTYENVTFNQERNLNFKDPASYRNSSRVDFGNINDVATVNDLMTELTTGSGFVPIGFYSTTLNKLNWFSGIYKGNNYKIENIHIEKPSNMDIETNVTYGLFGRINNATIADLTVTGSLKIPARVSGEDNRGGLGGIVGGAMGNSTLNNLKNYATVYTSSGRDKVSGILGEVLSDGNVTITNCENHGDVSNSNQVAGIIAYSQGNVTIENCKNYGTIFNTLGTTGIAGIMAHSTSSSTHTMIKNCHNYGKITAENNIKNEQKVGGIAGNIYGTLIIENSHNEGEVISNLTRTDFTFNAGGILGRKTGGVGKIINSYNTGTVSGARRGGGIVGHIFNDGVVYVDRSYNAGEINCIINHECGGILGYKAENGAAYILNSYNAGTINNPVQSAAGIVGEFSNGTAITIYNSYNIGKINGKTTSNGIVQNTNTSSIPLKIKNVYNAGELANTKYGIGNIATTSRDVDYAYFDNRTSAGSNISGIGIAKTLDSIKTSTFATELTNNIAQISLGDDLTGYKLYNWKLNSFPTLSY